MLHTVCIFWLINEKHKLYSFQSFIFCCQRPILIHHTTCKFMHNYIIQSSTTIKMVYKKNLTSQRNELIQKKYAVSVKLAYYLIAAPTLGLGLMLYYDVMFLVTIFSNQNYVVLGVRTNTWWWLSKNMLYQRKIWQVSEMSWFSKNMLCPAYGYG